MHFDTTEKRLESFVEPFQNILKYLAVDILQIISDFLDLRKLVGLVIVIQRNMIDFVGIAPFLKRGIIKFAAKIDSIIEFGGLRFTRKDAEFEGFLYDCFSHNRNYFCDAVRNKESFQAFLCFVFHYDTNSHFSQSRILFDERNNRLKARLLWNALHLHLNPKRIIDGVLG